MQKGKTFSDPLRDINPEKLSSEICRFSDCACVLQFYKLLLLHLDGAYIAVLLHLVRFFFEKYSQFLNSTQKILMYFLLHRSGGRRSRLVQPFEKNLNLTIIGPTWTLKLQGSDHNDKIFGPTKVGVVGPAPPALLQEIIRYGNLKSPCESSPDNAKASSYGFLNSGQRWFWEYSKTLCGRRHKVF